MSSFAKICLILLCACAPLGRAHAEDRLTTLERELDLYAEQGRRERIGHGVIAVALAGTLIPAGVVMTHRNDDLIHLIGIGTIVTGAVQLLRLPEFIFPSDMERMRNRYLRRKAEGLTGDALIAATEQDWREKAEQERKAQRFFGSFNLAVGLAAIPLGLTFMLRDQIGDMDHRKQLNVGSTMLGIGVGYITTAAFLLFTPGATERSWKSHKVALGLGPTAAGGLLTASGRF